MTAADRGIAVVGMECIYPGAPNRDMFWSNILSNRGKGGFPEEFYDGESMGTRIRSGNMEGMDPGTRFALKVAREAIEDAERNAGRPLDRNRTAVILGYGSCERKGSAAGILHSDGVDDGIRIWKTSVPGGVEGKAEWMRRESEEGFPACRYDAGSGFLPVMVGATIADRLALRGPRTIVDHGGRSSLPALELGVCKLLSGDCDAAVVGDFRDSADLPVSAVLSLLGVPSNFGRNKRSDMFEDISIFGSGIGMMVLKRLKDAERDGNRIYAVIRGMGTSSGGRGEAIHIPSPESDPLERERSHGDRAVHPGNVSANDVHGDTTRSGCPFRVRTSTGAFEERKGDLPESSAGAVESMISHSFSSAGMAEIIEAALALHHKIHPPVHWRDPDPDRGPGKPPGCTRTKTRPWIHGKNRPRSVRLKDSGSGNIIRRAILEEYVEYGRGNSRAYTDEWDTEVVILQSDSREGLARAASRILAFVDRNPTVDIKDIAFTMNRRLKDSMPSRLSIVIDSLAGFKKKLERAIDRLTDPKCDEIMDRSGIFYFGKPLGREGKLAFMFPGHGSQYVDMMAELCMHFPEVRNWFDLAEVAFERRSIQPSLSQVTFPPLGSLPEMKKRAEESLGSLVFSAMSICAANLGMDAQLRNLDLRPHAIVGHSVGEDIALFVSGVKVEKDDESFLDRYYENIRRLHESIQKLLPKKRLMSVGLAESKAVSEAVKDSKGEVHIAMDNCPNQVVLCGSESALHDASARLSRIGGFCTFLSFDWAVHTPFFRLLDEPLRNIIRTYEIGTPDVEVYSCTTASRYPDDRENIRRLMFDHWSRPVRFRETIESMYGNGFRIFVEVGPRGNLTSFVEDILRNRRHLAVPSNVYSQSSITQINFLVGLLAAHGIGLKTDRLYERRNPKKIGIEGLTEGGR